MSSSKWCFVNCYKFYDITYQFLKARTLTFWHKDVFCYFTGFRHCTVRVVNSNSLSSLMPSERSFKIEKFHWTLVPNNFASCAQQTVKHSFLSAVQS